MSLIGGSVNKSVSPIPMQPASTSQPTPHYTPPKTKVYCGPAEAPTLDHSTERRAGGRGG